MKRITCAIVAMVASGAIPAFAIDGRQIMQNAYDVKEPAFSHSAVKMDLIDSSGAVESRLVEEWGKSENDLVSTVMAFVSPASVKNTRFLQVQNQGRSDDRWLYLPALRSVRRIAASDGEKSFMGTDATYDDLETRDVALDSHELTGEEEVKACPATWSSPRPWIRALPSMVTGSPGSTRVPGFLSGFSCTTRRARPSSSWMLRSWRR